MECELGTVILNTLTKIIQCVALAVAGTAGNFSIQVISSGKPSTCQRWREEQLQYEDAMSAYNYPLCFENI